MKNKIVVITGTSSGIGNSAEKLLSEKGYTVIGMSRSFRGKGIFRVAHNLYHLNCDISSEKSVSQAISFVKKKYGKVDILINNAGFGIVASIEDIRLEDVRNEININLIGHIICIKKVIPLLKKSKNGLILNVISTGGRLTYPSLPIYYACKHAMESISESLGWELKKFGIKVSILEPGPVNSSFGENMKKYTVSSDYFDYYEDASEGFAKLYKNSIEPERVAEIILKMLEKYQWRKNTSFRDILWIWGSQNLPKKWFDIIIQYYFK